MWSSVKPPIFFTPLFDWMEAKGTNQNPWKDISLELPNFSPFTRCIVGNGRDTYFWEDQWVGDSSFCSIYKLHDLYHLSSFKTILFQIFYFGLRLLCPFPLGSVIICPIGKRHK